VGGAGRHGSSHGHGRAGAVTARLRLAESGRRARLAAAPSRRKGRCRHAGWAGQAESESQTVTSLLGTEARVVTPRSDAGVRPGSVRPGFTVGAVPRPWRRRRAGGAWRRSGRGCTLWAGGRCRWQSTQGPKVVPRYAQSPETELSFLWRVCGKAG
jgi:hypothetical protein